MYLKIGHNAECLVIVIESILNLWQVQEEPKWQRDKFFKGTQNIHSEHKVYFPYLTPRAHEISVCEEGGKNLLGKYYALGQGKVKTNTTWLATHRHYKILSMHKEN